MEAVLKTGFKTPLKKLVGFFERSRDKWKAKYLALRDDGIRLANKVRAVEKSRQMWKVRARTAQRAAAQAEAALRVLREQLKKT